MNAVSQLPFIARYSCLNVHPHGEESQARAHLMFIVCRRITLLHFGNPADGTHVVRLLSV